MKKIDVVLDSVVEVITHLRGIADAMQRVVDVFSEDKTIAIEANAVTAIQEETKESKKKNSYSLEDVRGILAEKSQAGFSAEVKALITKYGADRLSAIDESHYEDIIKEAEETCHE